VVRCSAKIIGVHDGLDLLLGQVVFERLYQAPQATVALGRARQLRE